MAAIEYIGNDKGIVNGLYTIGQPRIGNAKFAEHFDKVLANRCFRFINNNDIVPRVPLPGLVLKYTHAGHELYIDSAAKLHDADVLSWWEQEWDRLKGIVADIGKVGLDDLKDHGSEGYVALIAKNRAVSTQWS